MMHQSSFHSACIKTTAVICLIGTCGLKLLWMGVGKEDFLCKQAVAFDDMLKEKKIEHKSLITDGGHTWMNARHYLAETLQLYFK